MNVIYNSSSYICTNINGKAKIIVNNREAEKGKLLCFLNQYDNIFRRIPCHHKTAPSKSELLALNFGLLQR